MGKSPSELNTRTVRIGNDEWARLTELRSNVGAPTMADALRIALQQRPAPVSDVTNGVTSESARNKAIAGSGLHKDAKEQVACPDCRRELIAAFDEAGYSVKKYLRVRMADGSIVRVRV